MRATMGAYFVLGSALSIAGRSMARQVDAVQLRATGLLVPFLVAGFVLSSPARRWLDTRWLRPAFLAVSAAGAVLLIARSL